MTVADATSKMRDAVHEARASFESYGIELSESICYMDKFFRMLDTPETARFTVANLILAGGEDEDRCEYSVSLGIEIKHGAVDDKKLEDELESFRADVERTISVIDSYEDKLEALSSLQAEAEAEFKKLSKDVIRARKITSIVNLAMAAGIILLFIIILLVR